MRKRICAFFSCLALLVLFSACQPKVEEYEYYNQNGLADCFMGSLDNKSGNYTVPYLYYPDDSNEQTRELIQAIANSKIKMTRWGITDRKKGYVELTKRLYYYPLTVSYTVPGKQKESTMQLGIYEVANDQKDPNISKSSMDTSLGRAILDWDGVPQNLKEGVSQPVEDNGKTVIDLLTATA